MKSTALVFLLASACSGNKPSESTTPPPPTGGVSETSCSADADCVVVETACCDHCNGGKADAFNVAFAAANKATSCENTACTQMACGPATAKCEGGTCTATIGPLQ